MMEGHVQKKSNGRWYPSIPLPPDPETGKRRRATLGGFATRAEARAALQAAQARAHRGWEGPDRMTVGAYLDDWLEGVKMSLSPTTAALYSTLLRHHVIPRVGGERLQRLNAAALTRLYSDLLREGGPGGRALSPKSVRNIHTTVRKALEDAVAARLIDFNPAAAAKVPRIERHRELQVWSAANVTAFLQHIAEDRLAALYMLAATSGMRRGELLGLRWQDVDLDSDPPRLQVRRSLVQYGQTIIEKEPKTSRSRRTIALDPAAVAALRRHRILQAEEKLAAGAAYEPGGPVFSDQLGRPLRPAAISAAFQRHVKAARLPKLTLHGLRHTFATMGLELGVDTLYISEILGHSSPAITQAVYQHTREERLTSAVRQVGDAIFAR